MGKSFRSDDLNQSLLLPPSLHDWLPENHLARFLVDVVEALDLSAIHASYEAGDGRGQSAYAPAMMVRVLLYGYATGTYSSRKVQAKTFEDVRFVSCQPTSIRTTVRWRSLASVICRPWPGCLPRRFSCVRRPG